MRGASKIVLLACFLAIASTRSYAEMFPSGLPEVPLTQQDYDEMSAARQPLLTDDSLPIGTTREWNNAKSGNHGTIQLLGRFEYTYQGSKLPCRKLRYHVVTKDIADPYNFILNRCKFADGSWKIL
jgi:surface antigen